jgi:iron complex transport system substrate-binding protein
LVDNDRRAGLPGHGGCGSGDPAGPDTAGKNKAAGGFPVTVTDCAGTETVFTGPPKKIVTSNASSLELLLRLGAGKKVIGTGFPPGKGTLPERFDAQAQKVPVLSKAVIPKEQLLGSGADLYIDTFASMNMGGGMGDAPTEAEFKTAGIKHIYVKSTACAKQRKSPVTDLTAVEADITTLGKVTGRHAKAEELVTTMRQKVGAVQERLGSTAPNERPTYFFFDYDAGTKQPMAFCNRQVANAIITLAGARDVFEDCDGDYKQVGWEEVISQDPDWIQLGVRNRGSDAATEKAFDQARTWLETNPATRGLTAVEEGRFVRIGSERTTIAGVGNAETVEEIARTVHPEKAR